MTTAGLQLPLIPLVDRFGSNGAFPPAQIVRPVPVLNVGVIFWLTVTLNVMGKAHRPAAGVNV